ncbi:hypothetical protein HDU86_006507 [Geranomyces michiganensis]|nr:hypothetical protein HDU86_006507 [Geranomyces michiganensis]
MVFTVSRKGRAAIAVALLLVCTLLLLHLVAFSPLSLSLSSTKVHHTNWAPLASKPAASSSDPSAIDCTSPLSLKSSCHATNVCFYQDRLHVFSDSPEVKARFHGQTFLLAPMHNQALRKDRLQQFGPYPYSQRINVRVTNRAEEARMPAKRKWVAEQVVLIAFTGFGHYGHWLMDAASPVFRLMKIWRRLDYNTRIWTRGAQPGPPIAMPDAWQSVVKNPLSVIEEEALLAEHQGSMLCIRDMLWGLQIGAFSRKYEPFHFEFRDWALEHLSIDVPRPKRPKMIVDSRVCPKRCLLNEAELITQLRQRFGDIMDIEPVRFEGMTLRAQISKVQEATILLGASGTGTHNAIWLRNNSVVVDIMSTWIHTKQLKTEYYANSHICGANSPQTILCVAIWTPPTTTLARETVTNDPNIGVARDLPLTVDIPALMTEIEGSVLPHGLNEELINEIMSAEVFDDQ